jgi:hypothetical protein
MMILAAVIGIRDLAQDLVTQETTTLHDLRALHTNHLASIEIAMAAVITIDPVAPDTRL